MRNSKALPSTNLQIYICSHIQPLDGRPNFTGQGTNINRMRLNNESYTKGKLQLHTHANMHRWLCMQFVVIL